MTSRAECFVYITLPRAEAATLAGRFVLEETSNGEPLGRFVYGRSYLRNPDAVDIDPVELKLSDITYETTQLNGIFGTLRDAGPDFWGRRIIEKHSGKTQLGELDYLLRSPDDRAGALGFGLGQKPPAPKREFNQTSNSRSSSTWLTRSSKMNCRRLRMRRRSKSFYFSEPPWEARVQKRSSRISMRSGLRSSLARTTVGITRG